MKAFNSTLIIASLLGSSFTAQSEGLLDNKALLGGVAGAVAGKMIGGDTKAALIGGAVGGLLGTMLSKLDEADKAKRDAAAAQAAKNPVGQPVAWQSGNGQASGTLTKASDVYQKNGKNCMNVKETVSINGKPQEVEGVQCQVNGQWVADN